MADQGKPREPVWVSATSLALLGPLRLSNSAGDELTPKTRKSRALLAIVALAGAPVPRSRLVDLLWGDRAEEQAKASLRQALYELRPLTSSGALCADRQAVSLVAAKLPTDLAEIERAIASNDFARLALALESVRWPLLSDLDDLTPELDEWLRDERTRIASLILHGAAGLGGSALAAGKPAEARRIADAVERIDPLDECSARVGARADLELGDRTAAHRRLGRIAARLKDQLGIDLAPETKALLAGPATPSAATDEARTARQDQAGRPSKRTVVVLLLLAVAAAVALYLAWPRPVPVNPTVAVLPFEQIGQKQGYFASGVSDEILNLLARQKQFKVLGRVSAAQLANPERSLETARKLDVAYLLDGSVRTAGDRVLVIARLTRVSDGSQVWSERYERRAGDIFAVQGEIAGAVASRLAQSIAGIRPQETSPAIYDRYLAARQLTRERRDATLAESERLLREAINLDPRYAPAYAELAQVIMLRTDHPTAYGSIPFTKGRAEAEPFARKAVELDPTLGDGYAAVGFLSLSLDGTAEPYLRRAVELSPQRADFHRWHAQTLMALNRYDDAIAEYKRAVEIDPLWEISYDHLIGALYLVGRQAEGLEYARRFFSLTTDQRAKLMLIKTLHGFGSEVAAELKVAQTLYRAYPNERTSRLNYASPLALLGERRAAAPIVAYDPIATAVLHGDWTALARSSEALGPQFWDRADMWNASELLVASGHADSIVRLYDQVKPQLDREQIDPVKIALPEVIIALRQAGRRADADRQFALYRDHNAGLPARGLLGEDKSVNLGVIALLGGDRETAIRTLDLWSRRKPLRLLHLPAMALRYDPSFAALANDPRFPAIEERIRVAVNVQRAKAGLPAIGREAWLSDNRTLLTRN